MKSKLAVVMSVNGWPRIPHQRYTLQKDLGKNDRRSHVEINTTAIHLFNQCRQQPKVGVGCSAPNEAPSAFGWKCAMSPPIVT